MKPFVVAVAALLFIFIPTRARSAGSAANFEDQLAARGLIGGAVGDFRLAQRIPQPAEGVAASEIVANLASNGEEAAHATIWQESIAGHPTEFMVTRAPGGQTMAQYWVMRAGGGCELYQSAVYSKDGRLVTSDFWRNDPQALETPGAPEFPPDLFPNNALPIGAFFDSVGAGTDGASGKVDIEAGPFDFIQLDTWVDGFEKIDTPAGNIDTVKIVMRPNVDSVLKDWPRMFRKMALPFIPKDYFYFNSQPPHQMVQFEGTIGYPAPTLKAHLLKTWLAPAGVTPSPPNANLEDALAARGLIGGAMADSRAPLWEPTPAAGSVVDEIAMTLSSTHEPMTNYKIWHEPLGADTLEIQETRSPIGTVGVNYWVLPARGEGCLVAGVENWSRDGRLVSSDLWRNDPATLHIPGAMDFPDDLYPNISIPIDAFFRALQAHDGDRVAKVDLQVSPYTYISLDTWKAGSAEVTTEGGSLPAEKIAVRADVATILPSWPSALRSAVTPFFPKLILDYDATAPHDLIDFHGPLGWPAPTVDLQLTHRYVAGVHTQSAAAK
jgi:hypothetical protein